MNSLTKFTSTWFSSNGRSLATSLILGGFYIGFYFIRWLLLLTPVRNHYSTTQEFWISMGIINLFLLVLVALVYESEPLECPSNSQKVYRG